MPLLRIAKLITCALLILPGLIGCAAKNTYRLNLAPVVTESRFALIQNYGTADINPSNVDALLGEIADILGVPLQHSVRKVRIVVTSPDNITGVALAINSTPSGKVSTMPAGRYVEALYLPKVSVVLIPYFDRIILGHELAHYVTDHYLRHTPLAQWEGIADRVEHRLWATKPAPPSPAPPLVAVAQVETASREEDIRPRKERPSDSAASVPSETADGESVNAELVAGPDPGNGEVATGESDTSVPAPVQEPGADPLTALVAEPDGQMSVGELDNHGETLLAHALPGL